MTKWSDGRCRDRQTYPRLRPMAYRHASVLPMAHKPLVLAFPAWGFALVGVRESNCRRWVPELVLPDDLGHFSFHAESPRSSAISTGGFRCPVSNDEQPRFGRLVRFGREGQPAGRLWWFHRDRWRVPAVPTDREVRRLADSAHQGSPLLRRDSIAGRRLRRPALERLHVAPELLARCSQLADYGSAPRLSPPWLGSASASAIRDFGRQESHFLRPFSEIRGANGI